MAKVEGARAPSYSNVTANDPKGTKSSWLNFEPSLHMRQKLHEDKLNKGKAMEVEVESSHPKVA